MVEQRAWPEARAEWPRLLAVLQPEELTCAPAELVRLVEELIWALVLPSLV
jgi:hypothetical protein